MNVHARRFPLFDSLRGIAAIMVVIRHASDHTKLSNPEHPLYPFITTLGTCVLAIFFVVSGFLLYRPFAHARVMGGKRPGFGSYALGRFLRIYPAYWVALTITTLVLAHEFVFSGHWWEFYSLIYGYTGFALAGIGPAWSLCIEIAYYVFLPFFVLFVVRLPGRTPEARLRSASLAVGALVLIGLATRAYFVSRASATGQSPEMIPTTFLDWIGYGMGLALLTIWIEMRGDRLPRWLKPLDRFPGIAWGVAAAIIAATSLGFDEARVGFGGGERGATHVLGGLVALALVVPAALGDQQRGLIRRYVMGNRALLYLGLVSYGIFLWHLGVLEQLSKWHLERIGFIHPYLLWPLATLLITTAIASVSYYVLERPAMGLRRRLLGPSADKPRGEAIAEPAPAGPLPVRDPV